MKEKECITCKKVKPITDFHKTKRTKGGYNNKCAICKCEHARKKHIEKMQDKDYVKKRRSQHRKNRKTYVLNNKEKVDAHNKVVSMNKKKKSNEFHHWSYNKEHQKCIIELSKGMHQLLHKYLRYDSKIMMYRAKLSNNELLDTKAKHIEYINKVMELKGTELNPNYILEKVLED